MTRARARGEGRAANTQKLDVLPTGWNGWGRRQRQRQREIERRVVEPDARGQHEGGVGAARERLGEECLVCEESLR